jgi:hypothetical protein
MAELEGATAEYYRLRIEGETRRDFSYKTKNSAMQQGNGCMEE